jgi:hypothetical protein
MWVAWFSLDHLSIPCYRPPDEPAGGCRWVTHVSPGLWSAETLRGEELPC